MLDDFAVQSALSGDFSPFQHGTTFHVRAASVDPYLAPLVARSDRKVAEEASSLKVCNPPPHMHACCTSTYQQERKLSALLPQPPGQHHNIMEDSLMNAICKARDGDQIILASGVHALGGNTVTVTKRVLFRNEDDHDAIATIDQRSNSPALRILRSCVISGVSIDMSGHREAMMVSGSSRVQPLLSSVSIDAGSDDALSFSGSSSPILHRCSTSGAKHCGLECIEKAAPYLVQCSILQSERSGAKVMDRARMIAVHSEFAESEEDGVAVMEHASVELKKCNVHGNRNTGVDASMDARMCIRGCAMKGNGCNVMLMQNAELEECVSSELVGSKCALCADECTSVGSMRGTRIVGGVYPQGLMEQHGGEGGKEECIRYLPSMERRSNW
jgi:hypothetical protein